MTLIRKGLLPQTSAIPPAHAICSRIVLTRAGPLPARPRGLPPRGMGSSIREEVRRSLEAPRRSQEVPKEVPSGAERLIGREAQSKPGERHKETSLSLLPQGEGGDPAALNRESYGRSTAAA